jgi:hypothetical protein
MHIAKVMTGALIVVLHVLPAAALTKKADPIPTGYPLPPGVCDSPAGPTSGERCVPGNVDPRLADSPTSPERQRAMCCRPDIALPPHRWREPNPTMAPD